MKVLIGPDTDDLVELYAVPEPDWLRVNMVSTVDGAAWGSDHRSGSINNEADKRVFQALREQAEAIVVGAGTARAEHYRAAEKPLVMIGNSGWFPTIEGSIKVVPDTADLEGDDVIVLGEESVDLTRLRPALKERGLRNLLCEGGPTLLGTMLTTGIVDELCATYVPRIVGGDAGRITHGPPLEVDATLHTLIEVEGTLLTRWFL